ncbi:MAG: hypothetical protein ABIE84_04140, partial [bacterium]
MQITKIDESIQATLNQQIQTAKTGCKLCIYFANKACKLPNIQFAICKSCPKAVQYLKANAVGNLFSKIKGLAIMMMGKMGVG